MNKIKRAVLEINHLYEGGGKGGGKVKILYKKQ
jgi:hypothetical protein